MIQYNDYELLYLMSEFDEEAERIFFEKYSHLIKARIYKFKIKDRFKEDYFQEGLYMLMIAIRTYNQFSNKSFNKYFDLILQRKFMKLIEKEKHYIYDVELSDNDNVIADNNNFIYGEVEENKFSDFENKVIYLRQRNYKPKEIANILNCDVKSIYNCICRIKGKYNN